METRGSVALSLITVFCHNASSEAELMETCLLAYDLDEWLKSQRFFGSRTNGNIASGGMLPCETSSQRFFGSRTNGNYAMEISHSESHSQSQRFFGSRIKR